MNNQLKIVVIFNDEHIQASACWRRRRLDVEVERILSLGSERRHLDMMHWQKAGMQL